MFFMKRWLNRVTPLPPYLLSGIGFNNSFLRNVLYPLSPSAIPFPSPLTERTFSMNEYKAFFLLRLLLFFPAFSGQGLFMPGPLFLIIRSSPFLCLQIKIGRMGPPPSPLNLSFTLSRFFPRKCVSRIAPSFSLPTLPSPPV